MLTDRTAIEEREYRELAGYASHSGRTRGRKYAQKPHPLRTSYQRDRDRIIHSAAFRRMEHKTQVFLPHEGDHFRTRLTHTIEVAQIARTLARSLALNEDLAEAVALAHDLGHTPFGHAGEDVLNDLLSDKGGFNHNRQSLRVVDYLEQRYAGYPGLNLTYEVREGIVKHETTADIVTPEFNPEERPTLEASLVDHADEIAYNAADVDDGLNAKLISFDDLSSVPLLQHERTTSDNERGSPDQRRYAIARNLVNRMATDLLQATVRRIESAGLANLDDVRACRLRLVGFSDQMAENVRLLKSFLSERVYHHPSMLQLSRRARTTIESLYARFTAHPDLLPERFARMLEVADISQVVSDYIAGMTDRYAERQAE